ncbi:MAG: hypothetical protein ACOZBW_12660 [Thermodesulfobacteriota bacterium]
MKNDPLFYTVSVADLCARQGHFEKSAEIYAFLLEREPGRQDLKQALDDVKARLEQAGSRVALPENRLESLLGTWVSLLVENNLRQKFESLRESIRRVTPKS